MRVVAIIPARLESTRLPRKMLLGDTGEPLIVHTANAVRNCRDIDETIVATDSREIFDAVKHLCDVRMTKPAENGTARIAQLLNRIGEADLIINIQGDEPEIDPDHLSRLINAAMEIPSCDMATLCTGATMSDQADPNVVKVKRNTAGSYATEFSRIRMANSHRHIGVYAYRPEFLEWFVKQPPSAREISQRLEQLRALDAGCRIRVVSVPQHHYGIDTREQYDAFVSRFRSLVNV